ncbi:unnamed protein product [Urochloa humidicola]
MAPVILKTFVHCSSCAGRIQRAIKKYSGVDEVLVSVDTGLILVSGRNLDASFLKWRIQSKIRKCRVDIISDGTAEEPLLPQYAAQSRMLGSMSSLGCGQSSVSDINRTNPKSESTRLQRLNTCNCSLARCTI